MGATLPLLTRATGSSSGSNTVSRLYAANTAGAVVGTLVAGFVLIGLLGLRASALLASALNIGVGVYLLISARGVTRSRQAPDVRHRHQEMGRPPATQEAVDHSSSFVRMTAVLVFAISGFTGLAYEVVWTRLAGVLVFGLTYGFTAMLGVLLAGIAIGSALYGRWLSGRAPAVLQLAWLQVGIGALIGFTPLWLAGLANRELAARLTMPLLDLLSNHSLYCSSCTTVLPGLLLVVFITAVLFGAAFPAAVRVCAGVGPRWTARFGGAYAANVLGAVVGSLAAGFVLLPALGAHTTLLALATLNVVGGFVLVLVTGDARRLPAMALVGILPLALTLLAGRALDVYQSVLVSRISPHAQVLWYREGVESSVAVTLEPSPQSASTEPVKRLLINGDYHSSTEPMELSYHRLLGHLGPLLHPEASDILVVGLAGGATAGATALYPGVHVHVVELSDAVFGAAEQYASDNYAVLSSPKVTLQNDDGRNHLLVSGKKYDLIEGDLLYPRHVGSGVIYSQEYFELERASLKPGGLVVQWLGNESEYRDWTVRTFASVFPYVEFWSGAAIGSNEPIAGVDRAWFETVRKDPLTGPALADVHLTDFSDVLRLQDSDPYHAKRGPSITDDRPAIEYFLTLPLLSRLTGQP